MSTLKAYENAKEIYAQIGVDVDAAVEKLSKTEISVNCWQGDDVSGFLFQDTALSGGIQATGNYPGKARTPAELRADAEKAFSLIPGKHRFNLHSIYADTTEKPDLDELEPHHFATWVDWAKDLGIALDFNPTCFSHPMADSGFTISSADKDVRDFWIRHCQRCRVISEHFGKTLGSKSVDNFWFPDGYKDTPVDREAPRRRMMEALDEVFSTDIDTNYTAEAIESKVFGIGAESYTVGSNEFCLGYASSRDKMVCLDAGHFHPTEVISDKISSVLLFTKELLLHVSRPVRWDSDHVVTMDDELMNIAHALVRNGAIDRTHIGLDFFDASINRIAAWVIGTRNMQKALLRAMLEPTDMLKKIELDGNYTKRLALMEELKFFPYTAVWDYFCEKNGVPVRDQWYSVVEQYEKSILEERK